VRQCCGGGGSVVAVHGGWFDAVVRQCCGGGGSVVAVHGGAQCEASS